MEELRPVIELLVERRKFLGLTQRQLADKIGVTQSALCFWELGQTTIQLPNLIRWLVGLGMTLDLVLRVADDGPVS